MKLFSFCLLTLSFVLVGFGLLNPNEPKYDVKKNDALGSSFNCDQFESSIYSVKLNNRLCEYMDRSVKQGVKPSKDKRGIQQHIRAGRLELVEANTGFELDTFQYSYAALTPYAKTILYEIGKAFHDSLQQTPLANTKLIVTSMTRTHYTVSKLVRHNRTAVRKSPHLNGNSFDFSFSRFVSARTLTDCEVHYLQELCSSILFNMKKSCKIWATFEKNEECLHVVARMGK
ncbi:MAG: hypothetical protein KA736_08780 [Crocinitomicaceae bacterium]|nr:hypothetical protein [Crocinitomicaceae bacterium]MBP6033604.1 hypothetical protein [Crocinitomicaceae bacterium]